MIIAVDFDGVIHDYKNPIEGRRMGAPIAGTKEALAEFEANDHRIIIFSVWGNPAGEKIIRDFMNYYELPYHEITNVKPQADLYIDDKAIRFTNWEEVLQNYE
jgi:hypothetical protein